eukprot:gene33078-42791_t
MESVPTMFRSSNFVKELFSSSLNPSQAVINFFTATLRFLNLYSFISHGYFLSLEIDRNVRQKTSSILRSSEFVSKAASSFSSSNGEKFMGVGFNSIPATFDPTTMDDWRTLRPSEALVPKQEDLSSPTTQELSTYLLRFIVSNIDMTKVSETSKRSDASSVQRIHLDALSRIPLLKERFVTTTETKESLKRLNCPEGDASANSVPDALFVDSASHVRGICIAKTNVSAPIEGGRQGFAEASNVAWTQVKLLGVSAEDVMVPIMSTTGHLVQFSVMVLLKPFFPMVFQLTKVLDLSDSADRGIAAGHLKKIMDFLGLSKELYYLKPIKNFFPTMGYNVNISSSAMYFLSVMRVLHRDLECRQFVVFPYCFGQWKDEYGIVFPNLIGYRIVEQAMKAMHSAGVVHLDWYLSNFMWQYKPDSGELSVKIIDFDSAHLLSDSLTEFTRSRLIDSRSILADEEKPRGCDDVRNYDISLMRL